VYVSAQTLDFLARRKNPRFPNRKPTVSHPEFPDGNCLGQFMSYTKDENMLRLANSELSRNITVLEESLLLNSHVGDALKESEKRYRRLFESARDGILILDAETGRVVDVNPFLLELLGYSYEDLCGQYLWELGVFKDIAASKEAFKTLQDNEYIRYEHLPLETSGGKPIAVEFVSNVYLVDNSKVIQCNIRDITEQLKLAEQVQQARKMEAIGLLAGGVAHDYNNMLTVILGYAGLALSKVNPSQPLYEDLQEIINAANRSADITRQLLAFARKQTIAPVELDLNRAVESSLKMLRRLVGEDVSLVWQPATELGSIRIDPIQIDQILANLCVNARDAIENIGNITIETGKALFDEQYCDQHIGFLPGRYIVLAVSDDGCGMNKEMLRKIYEPFFSSKEVGKGTGLGLSTVYGIVKQNNGFINVYSEPGNGTIFHVYLPQYSDSVANILQESVEITPEGHGETILFVEDEPALLKLGVLMLEQLGYHVLAAGTPGEALALAGDFHDEMNLLITDVVMPEMNGRELAERIKILYPAMQTLFMSGYTASVITQRGVLEDGVNFIQKPFSMKDLGVKIRSVLD
jgi:two-component system, cell cycle sensor histidine kinase and response regulator CckA